MDQIDIEVEAIIERQKKQLIDESVDGLRLNTHEIKSLTNLLSFELSTVADLTNVIMKARIQRAATS